MAIVSKVPVNVGSVPTMRQNCVGLIERFELRGVHFGGFEG